MKTLLIDGNNAFWRIANGLPDLTVDGKPVQVVYGFMKLLRGLLEDFEPDKAIIFWDSGKPEYRMKLFSGYKASRYLRREEASRKEKEKRKQAVAQLETVKKLLPLLGVYQVSRENTEADDLIAVASRMSDLGLRVIVSGDQDFLQLVKRHVRVFMPSRNQLYRHTTFEKLIGLTPTQWLEYRILTGDSSDEIPSVVSGFGEKTALELLREYETIGNLLKNDVRKKVEQMGARFAKFYSPGVAENISRNYRLMRLDWIPQESKLRNCIRKELAGDIHLRKTRIQQEFRKRRFVSLLANFNNWLIPFKGLGT